MRHPLLIILTLFLVAGCQRDQPKSKARTDSDPEAKTNPEQKAIAIIEQLGGEVRKRRLRRGTRLRSSPQTVEKEIVVWVKLSGTKVDDAGLARLKELTKLRNLDLDGTKVTDAGLVHIKGLPLEGLYLNDTQISDAGLAPLSDLRYLRGLDLANTLVTDEGLVHLKHCRWLFTLDLRGTKVSDSGLAHLAVPASSSLQELNLAHTQITDAGLAHLAKFKKDTFFSGTRPRRGGSIGRLEGSSRDSHAIPLEKLHLRGTKVTNAGLLHLKGLANLQHLCLGNTKVTNAGIQELRKTLPGVRIFR
jgi:internalin A